MQNRLWTVTDGEKLPINVLNILRSKWIFYSDSNGMIHNRLQIKYLMSFTRHLSHKDPEMESFSPG